VQFNNSRSLLDGYGAAAAAATSAGITHEEQKRKRKLCTAEIFNHTQLKAFGSLSNAALLLLLLMLLACL